jgi:hypothetical protein
VCAAAAHALGESRDPLGVRPVRAEVLAGDVPVGALARTGRLDVGCLFACLPASGEHDGALDSRSLLTIDMLGIRKAQRLEIPGSEVDVAG